MSYDDEKLILDEGCSLKSVALMLVVGAALNIGTSLYAWRQATQPREVKAKPRPQYLEVCHSLFESARNLLVLLKDLNIDNK